MIVISKHQMQALAADAHQRFCADLMAWLRRQAPRSNRMDDATLLSLIERQRENAAEYGLYTRREIAKWCYLVLITSEDVASTSPVSDMLRDTFWGSRPGERLDNLLRQLAQRADRRNRSKGDFNDAS